MHRPFEVLADWLVDARPLPEPSVDPPASAETSPEQGRVGESDDEPVSDDKMFADAMQGVRPVTWNRAPAPGPVPVPAAGRNEPRAALEEVCRTAMVGPVEKREYVEGANQPLGRLYLGALREGRFAIQAHLDLHGMTVSRARGEVDRFVRDAYRAGHSCVRIVHGRGRHSGGREPRMKPNVERWLGQRRLARFVLAYATANPVDGGGGAVYVLLKRGG